MVFVNHWWFNIFTDLPPEFIKSNLTDHSLAISLVDKRGIYIMCLLANYEPANTSSLADDV